MLCKTAIFTNISCLLYQLPTLECHHKSSNNNLNIYKLLYSRIALHIRDKFLVRFSNDPQHCKRLWKYAYHVTTPQNVDKNCSRRKIHSDKKLFKLYFKFNLCWYIFTSFCSLFRDTFQRENTFFVCASDAPKGFNSTLDSLPPKRNVVFLSLLQKAKTKSKHFITLFPFFRRGCLCIVVCFIVCRMMMKKKFDSNLECGNKKKLMPCF